jgi:hypothetical protein
MLFMDMAEKMTTEHLFVIANGEFQQFPISMCSARSDEPHVLAICRADIMFQVREYGAKLEKECY